MADPAAQVGALGHETVRAWDALVALGVEGCLFCDIADGSSPDRTGNGVLDQCEDEPCNDGDPCTTDTIAGFGCRNEPVDCDDGLFCNGEETCVDGVCLPGVAPCLASQTCNEPAGACRSSGTVGPPPTDCSSGAGCDDGDACTIDDTCVEGVCSGIPMPCDAGEG